MMHEGQQVFEQNFREVSYETFKDEFFDANMRGARIRINEEGITKALNTFHSFSEIYLLYPSITEYFKEKYSECKAVGIETGDWKGFYLYTINLNTNIAFKLNSIIANSTIEQKLPTKLDDANNIKNPIVQVSIEQEEPHIQITNKPILNKENSEANTINHKIITQQNMLKNMLKFAATSAALKVAPMIKAKLFDGKDNVSEQVLDKSINWIKSQFGDEVDADNNGKIDQSDITIHYLKNLASVWGYAAYSDGKLQEEEEEQIVLLVDEVINEMTKQDFFNSTSISKKKLKKSLFSKIESPQKLKQIVDFAVELDYEKEFYKNALLITMADDDISNDEC